MRKNTGLLFTLVFITLSLMTISLAVASIPEPSVPEFTLDFVDESYDVPTTYSIGPYTGENVTHPGYHVPRTVFKMTIKNQPFVPYYDEESGWNITLYYNIRVKGSYSEDWIEMYRPSNGYPLQSDSEHTVISLGTLNEGGLSLVTDAKMIDLPSGGQLDFQVEAMVGYVHRSGVHIPIPSSGWGFTGETSGWSNTQTITIPASSTLSPILIALVIASVCIVAVVCIGSLVYFKKLGN